MSDSDHDDLMWGIDCGERKSPTSNGAEIGVLLFFHFPILMLGLGFYLYFGITEGVWDPQVAGTFGFLLVVAALFGLFVLWMLYEALAWAGGLALKLGDSLFGG
jgi:hypothetical protein